MDENTEAGKAMTSKSRMQLELSMNFIMCLNLLALVHGIIVIFGRRVCDGYYLGAGGLFVLGAVAVGLKSGDD